MTKPRKSLAQLIVEFLAKHGFGSVEFGLHSGLNPNLIQRILDGQENIGEFTRETIEKALHKRPEANESIVMKEFAKVRQAAEQLQRLYSGADFILAIRLAGLSQLKECTLAEVVLIDHVRKELAEKFGLELTAEMVATVVKFRRK